MKKIVLASQNEHKLQEISPPLESLGFEVLSLVDFEEYEAPRETGATFLENARLKARALRKHTSSMILADDSGLEVEALKKAPGVQSKRFSDEGDDHANNKLLLNKMADKTNRHAMFRTVMVLLLEDGKEVSFEGTLPGYIHTAAEGGEGFGYDTVFIPVGHSETLASLGFDHKQRISHRKRCLDKVIAYLRNL